MRADRLGALGRVDADDAEPAALLLRGRSCGSSDARSPCRPPSSSAPAAASSSSPERQPLREGSRRGPLSPEAGDVPPTLTRCGAQRIRPGRHESDCRPEPGLGLSVAILRPGCTASRGVPTRSPSGEAVCSRSSTRNASPHSRAGPSGSRATLVPSGACTTSRIGSPTRKKACRVEPPGVSPSRTRRRSKPSERGRPPSGRGQATSSPRGRSWRPRWDVACRSPEGSPLPSVHPTMPRRGPLPTNRSSTLDTRHTPSSTSNPALRQSAGSSAISSARGSAHPRRYPARALLDCLSWPGGVGFGRRRLNCRGLPRSAAGRLGRTGRSGAGRDWVTASWPGARGPLGLTTSARLAGLLPLHVLDLAELAAPGARAFGSRLRLASSPTSPACAVTVRARGAALGPPRARGCARCSALALIRTASPARSERRRPGAVGPVSGRRGAHPLTRAAASRPPCSHRDLTAPRPLRIQRAPERHAAPARGRRRRAAAPPPAAAAAPPPAAPPPMPAAESTLDFSPKDGATGSAAASIWR